MNLREKNSQLISRLQDFAKAVYNATAIYDESGQPEMIRLWAQTASAEAMTLNVSKYDGVMNDSERLDLARALAKSVEMLGKNVFLWNQGKEDRNSEKLSAVERGFRDLVAEADYFEEYKPF